MKKFICLIFVLSATACTGIDNGSPTNYGSANACIAWQKQKQSCEKFNANSIGFERDGKIYACMKARGFEQKPQGCN